MIILDQKLTNFQKLLLIVSHPSKVLKILTNFKVKKDVFSLCACVCVCAIMQISLSWPMLFEGFFLKCCSIHKEILIQRKSKLLKKSTVRIGILDI